MKTYPLDEDINSDQDIELCPNNPKTYENFTNEVVQFSSRYTTPSNIVTFRRNSVITTPNLDETIIIEPCAENEKVSDGTPHFPLFWFLEPHKVPKFSLDLLSDEDRAAVEWLREREPIECSALLENEDNLAGLQHLLGRIRNMHPKPQVTKTMDDVAMLKALRAREKKAKVAEKKESVTVELTGIKQAGPEGGTSSSQRKKQNVDDGGNYQIAFNQKPQPSSNTQNPTNYPPNSSPIPANADKWWALFNDFEVAPKTKVGSIFDRRFPIESIVEKHLNRKEDRSRVNKATEAEMKIVERLKTDLVSCEKRNTELLAEKVTWDEKYSNLEKTHQDTVTEKKTLENTISTLTAEKQELASGKELVDAELEDVRAQVAMQHTSGFEKAISQIQFLYPDLKIDEVGAFKHIVDGKLVDIIVEDDED
ncbi:hypothetical protein SESBI_22152 [Sesbania bispinosa]|nr:hypothetical protein SESBI_22152 [Sesbania bispinosa]